MVAEDESSSNSSSSSSSWSWEQDKAFENALAVHSQSSPLSIPWEKITLDVPKKTMDEIRNHYDLLTEDINGIESGRVPLPPYSSSTPEGLVEDAGDGCGRRGGDAGHGGKGARSEQERRKGVAWTEDEHRLFLLGLDKYGKGDWRSISRNFVISRTPTQVASHAQKYFIRLNSMNKDRRRASIHDITSVGNDGDLPTPQGPITGQPNGPVAMASGKPAKPSSAVGTPVILRVPPGPHMAYGVRAPVAGAVVAGAPVNLHAMTYPMPHTSSHR